MHLWNLQRSSPTYVKEISYTGDQYNTRREHETSWNVSRTSRLVHCRPFWNLQIWQAIAAERLSDPSIDLGPPIGTSTWSCVDGYRVELYCQQCNNNSARLLIYLTFVAATARTTPLHGLLSILRDHAAVCDTCQLLFLCHTILNTFPDVIIGETNLWHTLMCQLSIEKWTVFSQRVRKDAVQIVPGLIVRPKNLRQSQYSETVSACRLVDSKINDIDREILWS